MFVALHLFNRFVDSFAVINAVAFVLFAASGEFRLDVAGKDCRNFYVERFKFDTKRLGKRRHRRFRAGIKRLKRQRQRRARAGHIDYRAAAVFAHNGDNRLRSEQRAEVIDVKNLSHRAFGGILDRARNAESRVVDKDVDTPRAFYDFADRVKHVFTVGHVGFYAFDAFCRRSGQIEYAVSVFREFFCNGIPDSLGCARNNCNFHNPPLNDYTIMFEYLQIVFKTLDSIFI